jgi:methionyl aminopeptidase
MFTKVKSSQEIAAMREGGRMLATVLDVLSKRLQPGMTPKDLSEIAKTELRGLGGQPAFLGYEGFPDVICISLNDEVVHGIPRADRVIKDGDIVSLDFGVRHKGLITDAAVSRIAGEVTNQRAAALVSATEAAMHAGIAVVKDGVMTGTIGQAVQEALEQGKYGIVRDLVGHGVGHELHEDPNVPNYGKVGTGTKLRAGMTIAIEPMATLGTHKIFVERDGWTIRTQDGSLAAHFEHTVLVTADGFEILTDL